MPDKTNTDFFDSASEVNQINLKAMLDKMMMHDTETRANQTSNLAGLNAQQATFASSLFADTMNKNDQLHNLTVQAMQNAIETANMVSKQAVKHSDVAQDRTWNVDEQGYQVADILNDSKFQDALAVALAKITSDMADNKA